ncbi:MAG TPA: DNA primase [Xanthobacteraceae bacterium]|nr:DNA primase [Xanthobacteraceae bacterium]
MRFPPEFLEELRARLPVSEVVGRRVKLKKAGREWKGLSPFNREKTPSFFVNDQKGAWFDFSSGRNGTIFDFVMAAEGVSFPEAVERLAAMAGLPLPVASKAEEARAERRKSLHEVMELAAAFFEATLAARTGAAARGYLADRGLGPSTQVKFRLGYAPNERYALKEHLGGKGIPVETMVEAGLLIAGDDIPVPYDRFRDRVIFPIADARGRVIAFGGRALAHEAAAKYLNSPETPIFHKGATLYNLAGARAAAHAGAPVIVVEGYVDVIALVEAGFPGAVAPLGTALTEDQLALLWKMADEPVLCFDGDAAGRRAAHRVVDLALPALAAGKTLRFASLPQGQDPDDLVRLGGAEAMRAVLAGAVPLADMLWARETENGRFETPERRAALERRLGALVEAIGDPIVRKYYREDLAARVRTFFAPPQGRSGGDYGRAVGSVRTNWPRGGGRPGGRWHNPESGPMIPSPRLAASALVRGPRAGVPPREALILLAVLNHPWLMEHHAEELAEIEFHHADADRLRRGILDVAAAHPHAPLEPGVLREALAAGGFSRPLARVEGAITHTADWPARPGSAEADVAAWWNHVIGLHRKQRTLHRELKDAERALGTEPSDENLRWLRDIQERLSVLEGAEALIEDFGVLSGRPARSF